MNLHLAKLHLTARARLTLLYTAFVGASGGVLVTVTYFLVAHNLSSAQSGTVKNVPLGKCHEQMHCKRATQKPY